VSIAGDTINPFQALVIVLTYRGLLFGTPQIVHRLSPHIAHRHSLLFSIFAGQFHQIAPTLLGERGNGNAQVLAFDHRIEAEARIADGLFHRHHHRLVPDADRDRSRLGNRDGAQLADRHARAVGLDMHLIEQAR
jgi:hypothetical protein